MVRLPPLLRTWLIELEVEGEALLTVLFPPRCGASDAPMAVRSRYGLSEPFLEVLEPNQEDPVKAAEGQLAACVRAPYLYGGGLARMLTRAKFEGREDLAVALGNLLADDPVATGLAEGAASVVPVPLGERRGRARGYNQSATIARRAAKAWGLPVRYALRRVRETAPQSDLDRAARQQNVAGAFACGCPVSGPVVLIDDVITSGATMREAARCLLDAGASEVRAMAVMRTELG